MTKIIFGKNVKFFIQNIEIEKVLTLELKEYEDTSAECDVELSIVEELPEVDKKYISPSVHTTFEKGFIAKYSSSEILYMQDDILKIYIKIVDIGALIKFISVHFRTYKENVGAILHELVFVPMMFFFDRYAPLHASSFLYNEKSYLIGGTGGVGKTSIELLYCKKEGVSFLSDDIAMVDQDGYLYPNFAYPKIYAYNVKEDKELEHLLLEDETTLGKFQWHFIKSVRGEQRVRRALSAVKLYGEVKQQKVEIDHYFLLNKSNTTSTIVEQTLSLEVAVESSLHILLNEYHSFFQHIRWHEYNAHLYGIEPIQTMDKIVQNMKDVLSLALKKSKNSLITVPASYNHKEFRDHIESIIG